ncbi:zinc finger BED domain-containing protein 4-like isoform X2 [Nilaparvata lugens]|uniref:zinc finger BED domain-containing protein 4-like isoform X2 n=1 Tax=Nilaparvata lugens TaxID=108931 RepID=UPI00193D44C5|nr:zinc finger BED domain-containing protein 4-like isoform X2 [Nilaparvata lugens]
MAKCRYCKITVKTSGNTSNLRSHIQFKHSKLSGKAKKTPEVSLVPSTSTSIPSTSASVPSTSASVPSTSTTVPSTSAVSNSGDEDDPCISSETSSTAGPSRTKQMRIEEVFSRVRSFKQGDASSTITQAIVYMICVDAEPLSIVEHKGFRRLIKTIAPLYKIPSRKTIRSAVSDKFSAISNLLKSELANIQNYSFTTDIWTDSQNRSYLSFTVHYCDLNSSYNEGNNCIEKASLGLFDLHERHTSEYISSQFENIVQEWGINKGRTTAVVTDSAANIVKAVELCFGKKHIPCFAHTLNLVATKGIADVPQLEEILKKVSRIVTWFHHSVAASDELRKTVDKKLIQDVPTRWNSTYDMLKRFLELRPFINDIVNRFTSAPPMILALELEILQEVVELLQPLQTATLEISSGQYLTSSMPIPIASRLLEELTSLNPKHEIGEGLKRSILAQHKKRLGAIENVHLLGIATLLDPRFKKEYFLDKVACSRAVNAVSRLMQDVTVSLSEQLEECDSPSSDDSDKDKSTSLFLRSCQCT